MAKYLLIHFTLLITVLYQFSLADQLDFTESKCYLPFSEFTKTGTINHSNSFNLITAEWNSYPKNRSSSQVHTQDASGNRSYTPFSDTKVLALPQHRAAIHTFPILPPFAPLYSASNEVCRNHSKIFINEVKELKMWALKMYDASAKIPSGLLNGNVNQYGDFDQCIGIEVALGRNSNSLKNNQIQGKYCLAYIDVKTQDLRSSEIMQLLQSHYMIRSNLSDPGHRLPRFSSINWAFCIPSSCSAKDLEIAVQDAIDTYSAGYGIRLSVSVNPEMCYTKDSWKENFNLTTILCFSLLAALIFLVLIATVIDGTRQLFRYGNGFTWNVINSFSLKRNLIEFYSNNAPTDDINCIHGIRFLNALALLLCHKSMSLLFNPFVNRTSMAEALSYRWTVIARTAIVYTDSFIMISGILAAYGFIKDLDKKGKLDIKKKYLERAIRLTPNFLAIILLCTYIILPLGSGPQWNMVVKHHSTLCQSYMWRNLLYIHNYFGFEDMCLTHTHQLGIDMQLFLISPFIVYILWRWTEAGFIICMMLGFISTAMRYIVTYNQHLSPVVYFGASVSQLFATANNSYILPTHRLTSYLFGIGIGFYLRRMEKNLTLSKVQVFFGWCISLAMGMWAMMGPTQTTNLNYVYKEHEAAFYMAFSPIMWCIFVGWVIFATTTGYGGFFGKFLSWKGFIKFTRIAYALYLVQFPIFFYNVGRKRSAESYDLAAIFNVMEILAVFVASIALTLIVDLPAQNLRKIFLSENRPGRRNEDAIPAQETEAIEKTRPNHREVINDADKRHRAMG